MRPTKNFLDVMLVSFSAIMGGFVGAAINTGVGPIEDIEWETLFTGFAAVLAAFFTIRTLIDTDISQGRRHSELLGLSLRSDRLIVDRLMTPPIIFVESEAERIRSHQLQLIKKLREGAGRGSIQDEIRKIDRRLSVASKQLKSEQILSSQHLWVGEMQLSYDLAVENAQRARSEIALINKNNDVSEHDGEFDKQYQSRIETLSEMLEIVVMHMNILVRNAQQLEDQFLA